MSRTMDIDGPNSNQRQLLQHHCTFIGIIGIVPQAQMPRNDAFDWPR